MIEVQTPQRKQDAFGEEPIVLSWGEYQDSTSKWAVMVKDLAEVPHLLQPACPQARCTSLGLCRRKLDNYVGGKTGVKGMTPG